MMLATKRAIAPSVEKMAMVISIFRTVIKMSMFNFVPVAAELMKW